MRRAHWRGGQRRGRCALRALRAEPCKRGCMQGVRATAGCRLWGPQERAAGGTPCPCDGAARNATWPPRAPQRTRERAPERAPPRPWGERGPLARPRAAVADCACEAARAAVAHTGGTTAAAASPTAADASADPSQAAAAGLQGLRARLLLRNQRV